MTDMNRYSEKLSRTNCAVVFVDYLTGFLPGLQSIERNLYDGNVKGFCLATKTFGLPHCVIGDEGSFRGEFFPIIKEEFRDSPTFERHSPSAWDSGPFKGWVEGLGRKKIVLGGISIDNCTMMTTLDLVANGYEAYVVVDVSGAETVLVEQAAIARLVQAGVTPISWVQFACEVLHDWQTPEGPAIGQLLSEHSRWGGLGVPHA